MITKKVSEKSIASAHRELNTKSCQLNPQLLRFACSIIAQTCKILYKLHSQGIIHRRISMRSIKVKFDPVNQHYTVKKLNSFDLAIALDRNDLKIV